MDAIVGLDFAFSMPGWFLRNEGVTTAFQLWARAEVEGERWLRDCTFPFWGPSGQTQTSASCVLQGY